jgi:hypothetical protein
VSDGYAVDTIRHHRLDRVPEDVSELAAVISMSDNISETTVRIQSEMAEIALKLLVDS